MGRLPNETRFWARVDRSDPAGCWPFLGARHTSGYGFVRVGETEQAAHRVAWELTNGPIPDGLLVCHHCDNRPCCNPNHLFLGTHRDNTRDMDAKGRRVIGRRSFGKQTHCPQGHPYSGDNLRIRAGWQGVPGTQRRMCLTCSRQWTRDTRARRRLKEQSA